MSLFHFLYRTGDKIEDVIRGRLSHYPIIYAFIGGTGIVIFWRGVWHSMDALMEYAAAMLTGQQFEDIAHILWWDGPLSLVLGTVILLATGVFTSNFIGNEIIISGLRGEKKVAEKTEAEVEIEASELATISREIHEIRGAVSKKAHSKTRARKTALTR